MAQYSSGHTFEVYVAEVDAADPGAAQLSAGWYAQWNEDRDIGEVYGPFPCEEAAARVFLDER